MYQIRSATAGGVSWPAMDIYLDDEAMTLEVRTLGELIHAAQGVLQPRGRVLTEVHYDGQELSAEQMMVGGDEPIAATEVRLYSAEPAELALGALEGARQELEKIDTAQKEAAELFQSDRELDAMTNMRQVIQSWQDVQQAIQHSAEITDVPLEQMTVDGRSVLELADRLADQLRELQELLVNQDTLATADVLQYEWPDTVATWDRLVETLMQRIQSGS